MEKFRSPAAAQQADRRYYRSLTAEQRLDLLFALVAQAHPDEAEQRLARVCRVVKRQGR
jgi:hypothetical protein